MPNLVVKLIICTIITYLYIFILSFSISKSESPDYGFHLFRHTHDSMLLNADKNWKELQVRMGHKLMSTTMDTYAELAPQRKLEVVSIYLDKIAELTY